jgi:hypothetical protein
MPKREMIAVYPEIHTKHWQNVEFFRFKSGDIQSNYCALKGQIYLSMNHIMLKYKTIQPAPVAARSKA